MQNTKFYIPIINAKNCRKRTIPARYHNICIFTLLPITTKLNVKNIIVHITKIMFTLHIIIKGGTRHCLTPEKIYGSHFFLTCNSYIKLRCRLKCMLSSPVCNY